MSSLGAANRLFPVADSIVDKEEVLQDRGIALEPGVH